MTTAQVRAQDGPTVEALSRGRTSAAGGNGETVAELADRVGAALASILQTLSDGGTALVVCHGVAGRAGVAALLGLDQLGAVALLRGLGNAHWAVVAEVSDLRRQGHRNGRWGPGRSSRGMSGPCRVDRAWADLVSCGGSQVDFRGSSGDAGCSAVGSAPPWHGGGRGSNPLAPPI